jgi:hypothetical protein
MLGVYSEAAACIRQNMYTADRNIPSSYLLALPCVLLWQLHVYFSYIMRPTTVIAAVPSLPLLPGCQTPVLYVL